MMRFDLHQPACRKTFIFLVCSIVMVTSGQLQAQSAEQQRDHGSVLIDVSGKRGHDGEDGYSYSSGSSASGYGSDGRDGGDAGRSTRGQDAGSIELQVFDQSKDPNAKPEEAGVVIIGNFVMPSGDRRSRNWVIPIETLVGIRAEAEGGDGGHGGNGGRGQDGARGRPGVDATRYSWGTDGGPGGDGGNGGDATSGSDGAKGGRAEVTMRDQDTHVMMAFSYNVDGGEKGRRGTNGDAGRGGPGGEGGDSLTWVTTTTSRDSKGNTTTHFHTHFHPGGSDGADGRSGRHGNAVVRDGRDGEKGEFILTVILPDGARQSVKDRYRLHLVSYDLVTENDDGIAQPGERVYVKNMVFQNDGAIDTPLADIRVELFGGEWIETTETKPFVLPKRLAPGQALTVADPGLSFKIRNHKITEAGARFEDVVTLSPAATVTQINRRMPEFSHPVQIPITFPLEITPLSALSSAGPGQAFRVFWKVTNRSRRAYGSASELRSVIKNSFLRVGGDLDPEDILFVTPEGQAVSLTEGFLKAIERLEPDESRVLEGYLAISEAAEVYRDTVLENKLEVGSLADPTRPETHQFQHFELRIAQTYVSKPGSDILLVTNHKTTREELKAWEALLARYALSYNVWDLSLNGYLDFMAEINTEGSTLSREFFGKTVVVLNNSFEHLGDTIRGDQFISVSDLDVTTRENGVNFLFVSEAERASPEEVLGKFLGPTEAEEVREFDSLDQFWEVNRAAQRNPQQLPDPDYRSRTQVVSSIPVTRNGFWRPNAQRSEGRLQRMASAESARLNQLDPGRQYRVVVDSIEPTEIRRGWFRKTYRIGTLKIEHYANAGDMEALMVASPGLHNPEVILGKQNELAFLLGLTFRQKVERLKQMLNVDEMEQVHESSGDRETTGRGGPLNRLFHEEPVRGYLLLDAITVDLYKEQKTLRSSGPNGGLEEQELYKGLAKLSHVLRSLGRYAYSPESVEGELLIELIARLEVMSRNFGTMWDSWWWPFSRRSSRVRDLSDRFTGNFLGFVFPKAYKGQFRDVEDATRTISFNYVAKKRIDLRVRRMEEELDTLRSQGDGSLTREEALGILLEKSRFEAGVLGFDEISPSHQERVVSLDQWNRQVAQTRERQKTLRKRREAATNAKSDLLVDPATLPDACAATLRQFFEASRARTGN